jgi:L-asparaginase
MQVAFNKMTTKIVFLGTGGTIAGTASSPSDNVGYLAAQVGVDDLLVAVPGLSEALKGKVLLTEQIAQVDSKDMSFEIWQRLALSVTHHLAQDDVAGLVITHGTDTLEETAFFLHSVLPREQLARKPVVLTCAMRPASSNTPDGPQNMLDAVSVVNTQGAHGVLVVCAGTVHGALAVQKVHPYRLDAFSSGDSGPIAFVEEGVIRLVNQWPLEPVDHPLAVIQSIANTVRWPRVEIVMNYVGASSATVEALMHFGLLDQASPLAGLVVAATGNGTIHSDMEAALNRAVNAGVSVVVSTRCPLGCVIAQQVQQFKDAQGLSPVKARVALMLSLMGRVN